jgi:hypothetical protein
MKLAGIGTAGSAALAALSLVLAPALAASAQTNGKRKAVPSLRAGSFTPAVADPGLAAELARRGFQGNSFRFTPASTSSNKSGAVRVAVRARGATPAQAIRSIAEPSTTGVTAITPTAYNLGVSVGWRGFALSGDVARVRGGPVPGGREAAEVGVSYSGKRFTGRLEVGADRVDPSQPRVIARDEGYSVGVGGSYRLTRNLDLTAGARYKIQRDRLEPLADQRRDSQAVYVGTAFRF